MSRSKWASTLSSSPLSCSAAEPRADCQIARCSPAAGVGDINTHRETARDTNRLARADEDSTADVFDKSSEQVLTFAAIEIASVNEQSAARQYRLHVPTGAPGFHVRARQAEHRGLAIWCRSIPSSLLAAAATMDSLSAPARPQSCTIGQLPARGAPLHNSAIFSATME